MGARQQGNALVVTVATEAKEEPTRTLEVGYVSRRNGDTEGGAERFTKLENVVSGGVKREEFGSVGRAFVDHLDKRNLDLGKARCREDFLDAAGSGDGSLEGEGTGCHADGEEEWAEGLFLSFVGPTQGVDAREVHA